MDRFVIKNTTTGRILFATNSLEQANDVWDRTPRRRFTELVMLDNNSNTILKRKEPADSLLVRT